MASRVPSWLKARDEMLEGYKAVPDVDVAVAPAGRKGVVSVVECDGIHRVDKLNAIRILGPMTLEGVLLFLHFGARIEVLDSHTTLDGAEHKALLVGEAADAARLVLEVGLAALLHVAHVAQVPHEHFPLSRAHDKLVATHRHGVHLFRLGKRPSTSGRPRIPQLHSAVPASSDDHIGLGAVLHTPHGVIVRANNGLSIAVEVKRTHMEVFATSAAPGMHSILKERSKKKKKTEKEKKRERKKAKPLVISTHGMLSRNRLAARCQRVAARLPQTRKPARL